MKFLLVIGYACCLVSCQWNIQKKTAEQPENPLAPQYTLHTALYEAASANETELHISISEQRAKLLNQKGEIIFESDISTGIKGRPTPTGTYRVLERIIDKRSNKYGQYVRKDTREVVIKKAWEHEGKVPEGCVYQGIAMPYWMRLTWYGVGIHVGPFERGKRSSFGCIRTPAEAQPYIYHKTKLGTKVTITQ